MVSVVLSLGPLLTSCATGSATTDPKSSCVDERISEASAYRYDPATAIAVSHGIAQAHPDLKDIADAVAEHQRREPVTERLTLTDRRAMPADVSYVYIMVLVNLAARPDLARPETIAIVRDAATGPADDAEAETQGRGMIGIYGLVTSDRRVLEAGDPGIAELSTLVYHQARAVEDAGIKDILRTECVRDVDE